MQHLMLSYDPEDDSHGKLTAKVQSEGFAGRSAAWFGIERLRAFGEALQAFPITNGDEPTLRGGFWKNNNELDQTHVSIRIEPAGPQGRLRVKVLLATPSWDLGRCDQHSVQAQFLVNYSDVGAFQRDFLAMLEGELSEARLAATPT